MYRNDMIRIFIYFIYFEDDKKILEMLQNYFRFQILVESLYLHNLIFQILSSAKFCVGIFLCIFQGNTFYLWFLHVFLECSNSCYVFYALFLIYNHFRICETYPKYHIVPKRIADKELETIARFRALKRFPSVVWRYV